MKDRQTKGNKISQSGFTLVELMVSLTIFSVVMVISTGTLLIMIDINAKAQAIYSSSSNLTFALDNITREIRTGHHYFCSDVDGVEVLKSGTNDCVGSYISFTREEDDLRAGYRLNVEKEQIEYKKQNGSGWIPMTSDDVVITKFELTVSGTETYYENDNDTEQPNVDLFIQGYVNNGLDTDTDFTIQSHIIQRRLDTT